MENLTRPLCPSWCSVAHGDVESEPHQSAGFEVPVVHRDSSSRAIASVFVLVLSKKDGEPAFAYFGDGESAMLELGLDSARASLALIAAHLDLLEQ